MLDHGPCHYCGTYTDRASLVYWSPGDPLPEGEDGLEWLCARCDEGLSGYTDMAPADGVTLDTDVPY